MLITPEYKKQNALMHARHNWASGNLPDICKIVLAAAAEIEATSILDYGSGPRTMEMMMKNALAPGMIRSYDPAIETIDAPPEPADLLVSMSVLEHVEPECLDAVLDDMLRCTLNTAIIVISPYTSGLTLDDGTNPHRIVEGVNWWLPHLLKRWTFVRGDVQRQVFFKGTNPAYIKHKQFVPAAQKGNLLPETD